MSSRSNGSDERRVQPVQEVAGQLVTAPLAGPHGIDALLVAVEHVTEAAGAVGHVGRGFGEELEERVVARQEAEAHGTGTLLGVSPPFRNGRLDPGEVRRFVVGHEGGAGGAPPAGLDGQAAGAVVDGATGCPTPGLSAPHWASSRRASARAASGPVRR